jgi:hypothetical protein
MKKLTRITLDNLTINNTTSTIHTVPSSPSGTLDEVWLYLSSLDDNTTAATITINNLSITTEVSPNNSPLNIIPGISIPPHATGIQVATTGKINVHGHINRLEDA